MVRFSGRHSEQKTEPTRDMHKQGGRTMKYSQWTPLQRARILPQNGPSQYGTAVRKSGAQIISILRQNTDRQIATVENCSAVHTHARWRILLLVNGPKRPIICAGKLCRKLTGNTNYITSDKKKTSILITGHRPTGQKRASQPNARWNMIDNLHTFTFGCHLFKVTYMYAIFKALLTRPLGK
jgi:hypothetical protein